MWLTAGSLLVLVLWLVVQRLTSRRRARVIGLPGPRGYPLLGSALGIDKRRPYVTFARWSELYGDAFTFRMFSQPVVVLSSVRSIKEALVLRGQDYAGRPTKFRSAYMGDNGNDIVSGSFSRRWLSLKKIVTRELKRFDPGHHRMEALTIEILEHLVQGFLSHRGRPFDPREHVYEAIINTICLFLTGEKLEGDSKELAQFKQLERLITTSMNVGGEGTELDVFPWLRFLPNKTFRKLKEAKRVREELYAWAKRRVEEDIGEGRTCEGVMHGLFSLLASGKAPDLTENNLKLVIVNLLIGGVASTTTYLYLMLNVLVHYQGVQEAIWREVEERAGASRRVALSDREAMPYTRAALLELLRYGSLSPLLIPHVTSADTFIKNVAVPKGVWVFMNVHSLHHDVAYWGDPFVFRPERFFDNTGKALLPPEHGHRQRVMSFSGGPRACPGEGIALSRLFLAVTMIVQEFRLEGPRERGEGLVSCDPRTFDMGLVLSPKSFTLRCTRRADEPAMED